MKIITLHQPWASLVALGLKRYETRHWSTSYRGPLLVHAAKRLIDDDGLRLIWKIEKLTGQSLNPVDYEYPTGVIVAGVNLTDCLTMAKTLPQGAIYSETRISILQQSDLELAVGLWEESRFAFKLENPTPLPDPIPFTSRQGKLLDAPVEVVAMVRAQLKGVA